MLYTKKISLAYFLFIIIAQFQQLISFPTCGAIIDKNICIIGDIHTEYEPEIPEFEGYTTIIDHFIKCSSPTTTILLETPAGCASLSGPVTHAHFLRHVAKGETTLKHKITFIHADQRGNVLSAFDGLEMFWNTYLERLHKKRIHYFLRNREKICTYYRDHHTDAFISDCFEDLDNYVTSVSNAIRENFSGGTPVHMLLTHMHRELNELINTVKRFFDFVEDQQNTTVLEAILQKVIELQDKKILENIVMGYPNGWFQQLRLHVFNMCAALELFENLAKGKRVVIITGNMHALYLLHYLTQQLALPVTYVTGIDMALFSTHKPGDILSFLPPLPPTNFAKLLKHFRST